MTSIKWNCPSISCAVFCGLLQVDVILEEDKGFWAAIQTFMSTTKRPIILTASDPNATQYLDCRHELLTMTKSPVSVSQYGDVCLTRMCWDEVGNTNHH